MKIPFLNLDLKFRKADSSYVEIEKSQYEALYNVNEKFAGARTQLDPKSTLGDEQILIPWHPLPMDLVYDTAHYSDVLRTIHQNLRKEIFRHGYAVVENFANKCEDCGKEFKNQTDECDECGSRNMREPDLEQKKRLTKFCKNVNDNDQDIVQVSEEVENDHNIIDDGYMLMVKDYYWNGDMDLVGEVPVELLRSDPKFMRLIADKMGRPARNQNGDKIMFCYEHRHSIHPNGERCPQCKRQLFPAYYRSEQPDGKYIYYGKDEVCHKSKYNPSLTYGFSVIYAVWMKVITLMNMDQYMKNYYAKQRPPRGLLFVNTPNMDSLTKAWKWMLDEFKKNPHQIPPIAVEQAAGSKGSLVNFIDMMKGLDEMQYIEVRNESRRQIGAVYGVMPLFQADVSQSGGLNNEGLQITVTNRAITDGQGVYNEGYYPWVCDQLDVQDYRIELNPNEEQDLQAKEELRSKKIDNAMKMQNMGFSVTLNEEGDFEFDPIEEPVDKPDPFAGQMGAGGEPGQPGQEPDQDQSFTGMPDMPGPSPGGWSKSLTKGKVYLKPGEKAPEGFQERSGAAGGRYYETVPRITRQSLMNKPIEDMSDDELQMMQDWMENDETQYSADDLESAMRWLAGKPALRQKLGHKYYEFAVQVAEAINRGEDPETIDWASLDSQIPLGQSLWDQRHGELQAAIKKEIERRKKK